jgi:uncharacterized FlaG/YvyC family protein
MKAHMSSPLLLPPSAAAHQHDAVIGMRVLPPQTQATTDSNEPLGLSVAASSIALSFAYDTVTKALNVLMTDKHSGEVVRKISYTHLPSGVHRSDKLQGVLLDQLA